MGARGFLSITPKGVVLRGELNEDEWINALLGVERLNEKMQLARADIVNIGRNLHGDAFVDGVLEQLEFPLHDAHRAAAIAKIPWDARTDKLGAEHYEAVGAAELKPEERRAWLETATEQDLTGLELKRSIEAGKVIHAASTETSKGSGSGIVTISFVLLHWHRWHREAGAAVLADTPEFRERALAELQPIASFIDALRASFDKPTLH